MHFTPSSSPSKSRQRVLVISDEPTLADALALLVANAGVQLRGTMASEEVSSVECSLEEDALDYKLATSGEQGGAFVEAGVKGAMPFAAVMIDWRVFQGQDCSPLVRRMWNAQPDLHVVIHSVFDAASRGQMLQRLGSSHRLILLKHEMTSQELDAMAQSMAVKWKAERDLSLMRAQRLLAPDPSLKEPLSPVVATPDIAPASASGGDKRQICRLETMGRLTDGVAHDFNNFLTVIQSLLSVALCNRGNSEKLEASVEEVLKEAKRTSEVTRQLLAFNHREYRKPKAIRIEQAVDEDVTLLRRILGEDITIEVDHEEDLPPVMADHASLEQVLVSLAVRARDAMPEGGRLAIHTRRIHIPNVMAAGLIHPEATPGDFVVIALGDSGRALSAVELSNAFGSPADSAGTHGGSLLIAQELIRDQGGWIGATSVAEVGTEFSIHLPVATIGAAVEPAPQRPQAEDAGKETKDAFTILVVDDEEAVRQVMEFVLLNQGHTVITAKDANEAWTLWSKHSRTINLAIVDIKLPGGISGFDLERAIKEQDCTVPVIFTCGCHPAPMQQQKHTLKAGENYLPKPFGMAELLSIVNKAVLQPVRF